MITVNKYCWFILASLLLSACATKQTYSVQIHPPIHTPAAVKQLALFLDGTQNDRDSRTNVANLSEIVKHQDRENLYLFYNEGVGTDGKFIGAGTGLGIDKDVAEAYLFLSEYYTPDSKLYVFGFSRGAYTSRILAGMIYAVGIYDLTSFNKEDRFRISKDLYNAYKGKNKSVGEIQAAATKVIDNWRQNGGAAAASNNINVHRDVEIEVMGLWDTVEALGVIPSLEAAKTKVLGIKDPQNIVNPNPRYIDQICNIKHIYHALALDDNRANVFTPIIISSEYAAALCEPGDSAISKVEEVWFAGAHADVGGGYSKNEHNKPGVFIDRDVSLSGVSLNWMMSRIKESAPDLLPQQASVFENAKGYLHDAENGDSKYKRTPRHNILTDYAKYSRYVAPKIHHSVLDRLALSKSEREHLGFDSGWYALEEFKACFKVSEDGRYTYRDCPSLEVVK